MFIDGVFSGGGVKGLAFVGAYEVLEEHGFKFSQVAGTSAGAIIASFIAAGYRSGEIYEIFTGFEMTELLDEQKILQYVPFIKWLPLYWRLGMYKGQALEDWVQDHLLKKGIKTFYDLPPGTLRVIASDLTNGKIVVIPDDLEHYGISLKTFSVAKAVRMSCSIPYFFEPVKIRTKNGKAIFVDGGVLSNFPMWLFDQGKGKKKRPVLGMKLSPHDDERPRKPINNAIQMFEALFTTMLNAHDARYITKKHVKNIIFIPTNGILATEFSLTEEKKKALLQSGRERAKEFLKRWTY